MGFAAFDFGRSVARLPARGREYIMQANQPIEEALGFGEDTRRGTVRGVEQHGRNWTINNYGTMNVPDGKDEHLIGEHPRQASRR